MEVLNLHAWEFSKLGYPKADVLTYSPDLKKRYNFMVS